jgi:hypothetical protein
LVICTPSREWSHPASPCTGEAGWRAIELRHANWVEIVLGGDAEDADHFISPDERVQIAIARQ